MTSRPPSSPVSALRRTVLETPAAVGTPLVVLAMALLLGSLLLAGRTPGVVLLVSVLLAAASVAVWIPSQRRRR